MKSVPRKRLLSAPRDLLFAFAFLLLTLNAMTTFAASAVLVHGFVPALIALFDISAIVWLAVGAGLALLWKTPADGAIGRGDAVMLGLALLVALLPVPAASSAMLTIMALWGWRTSPPRSPLRRASMIFLSVTAFLLWGRIGLNWGAGPLLAADARFVALVAGTHSVGNAVNFVDGTNFVIAPACSSLHGISLALILWTTVVQYFAIPLTRRLWLTLALAIGASIMVNGARLSVIARNPHDFEFWHVGTGGTLFGWIALAVVVAVVYRGLGNAPRLA